LDEAGAEELLAQTVEAAKTLKAIQPRELRVVSIDTTVQEKNVAHPTDSRLLEVARAKLAERAAEAGIKLRQSYARTGPGLNHQAAPTVRLVVASILYPLKFRGGEGDDESCLDTVTSAKRRCWRSCCRLTA